MVVDDHRLPAVGPSTAVLPPQKGANALAPRFDHHHKVLLRDPGPETTYCR